MIAPAVLMVASTLPLTAYVRRSSRGDDAILLLLYIGVAAGFAAWFALPYVAWVPSTDTLLGIVSQEVGSGVD